MAKLVACRTCGKEVAETARACPHCGQGQPAGTPRGAKIFLAVVGGIALLMVIGIMAALTPSDKDSKPLEAGAAPVAAPVPADDPDVPPAAGSSTGYSIIDHAPPDSLAEDVEGLRVICGLIAERGLDSLTQPAGQFNFVAEADNRVAARLHEPIERANIVVSRVSSAFAKGTYGPSDCGTQ